MCHPFIAAEIANANLSQLSPAGYTYSGTALVGATAGGTALFALGVMLSGLTARLDKMAISVLLLKNFAQPALSLAFALAFHFSGVLSKGVVLAAACPCATASAMLASTYRIDEQPTTSAVVLSNIAGVLTMAMWIYVAEKIWA